MPENLNEIEITKEEIEIVYSTEMNDIISAKTNWIVSNGIFLFLIILLAIISITFFIEYPDIVNANAKLVSVNPPVELKTKVSGKLIRLLVNEKDSVTSGSIIGVMESVANADKVTPLYTSIVKTKNLIEFGETLYAINSFEKDLDEKKWSSGLGELQTDYNNYLSAYRVFSQYLAQGFYLKKKDMLNEDIDLLQKLHSNLLVQKGMQQEDVELAEKNFAANESLSKDRVISALDFRNERSKLINKTLSLPQLNASIVNNEAAVHEKRKEILQLENEIAQQKNIYLQALNGFIAALEQWQDKYLIKAPVSGTIVFPDFIQENQYYQLGQTICLVNLANTRFYAQVHISQTNFGSIDTGQQVLLKLSAYPYQEFGLLKGRLSYISQVPTDSGFNGKIILPEGLISSQHKTLQYREGLKAQAEIITSDKKLSDRLLASLKTIFDRNK